MDNNKTNDYGRIVAILIFILGLALTAWYFKMIVIYMFLALILTILGNPLVNLLLKIKYKKFHISQTIAALITLLVIISLFVLFIRYFFPLIASEVQDVLNVDTSLITNYIYDWLERLEKIFKNNGFLMQNEHLADFITVKMKQILEKISLTALFENMVHFVFTLIIGVFSVLFMTFFSLKDNKIFFKLICKIIPLSYRDSFSNILLTIKKQLVRYFSGVFLQMLIVGLLQGLLCFMLGVPKALLIGFIAGLLNIIPYAGPLIALILNTFIAAAGGMVTTVDPALITQAVIKIWIVFVVVKLLDDFLLQPLIYSKSVQSHPLEIFIVILAAGYLAGVLGMIIAVPAYSLIRIIVKEFFSQYYVKVTDERSLE